MNTFNTHEVKAITPYTFSFKMPDKGKGKKKHFSLWDGAALLLAGSSMSSQESKNYSKSLRDKHHPPEHYVLYDAISGPVKERYEKRRAAEKAAEKAAKKKAKDEARSAPVEPFAALTEAGPAPREEEEVLPTSASVRSHQSHRAHSASHSKSDKGKDNEKNNGKGKGKA